MALPLLISQGLSAGSEATHHELIGGRRGYPSTFQEHVDGIVEIMKEEIETESDIDVIDNEGDADEEEARGIEDNEEEEDKEEDGCVGDDVHREEKTPRNDSEQDDLVQAEWECQLPPVLQVTDGLQRCTAWRRAIALWWGLKLELPIPIVVMKSMTLTAKNWE